MLSERIFFVTERIIDILNFEKETQIRYSNDVRVEIKVKYLDDVREGMMELHKELSRLVDYLRHVEEAERDEQMLDHHLFYIQISSIAQSCDNILGRVISYYRVDIANDLYDLVMNVRNSYKLLPFQPNLSVNTIGNTNMSYGQQSIGPINISICPSKPSKKKPFLRPKSYGHVPNSDFVGFNHEIQTLLTHLLQHDETRVVGIVGMGGAGKTTLAKQIYHHPQIRTHFNRKVWVCISQSWDKTSILNSIWRQATQDRNAAEMDSDRALEKLYELLSSQSYLVILDDIWSINAWYDISPALPHNSGSKVVITTRKKVVPKCIDPTVLIIEPKTLNEEESLQLFMRRTLLPNENISPVLQQLGKKMVERCKGLPLAITTLAGILRMNKTQSNWEEINKRLAHRILNMEDDSTQGVVKEVLGLSYYELPHYLKLCVLYLRLFPEDYVIKSEVLIKMWIAECFIRTEEDDQISTAEVYIDEMVQRCIIEVVETDFKGQVSKFRIHDLIRQTFVDIDQKRGFLKDPLRYGDDEQNDLSSNLERIFGTDTNSQVRSFIFLHRLILKQGKLQRLFEKFRLLRVLIICDVDQYRSVMIMPEEIGNLIHLRYLELGGYIQLVESIGNRVNLWTLDLRNFHPVKTEEVMNFNLCKLKELRHLYFSYELYSPTKMELGRLKKLKTLCYVKGGNWFLSELPVLSAHLEKLRIYIVENIKEQIEAVFKTPSITSNNLRSLQLIWCSLDYELHDMNMLSKCESLNNLMLHGGIKVGTPILFPVNLIKLEITFTKLEDREVMNIISNSCPLLKILIFGADAYNGSELVCNANSFLQLEKLELKYQQNLRMWIIETSAMPSLHTLEILVLKDLDVNPEGWTFISNIPQLTFFGYKDTTFVEKLRMYRKGDQNLSHSDGVKLLLMSII